MVTGIRAIGSCPCVPRSTCIHAQDFSNVWLQNIPLPAARSAYGETLIQCATPYTCRWLKVSTPKASCAFGCEDPHSPTYTSRVWGKINQYASIYTCVVFEILCAPSRTGERCRQEYSVALHQRFYTADNIRRLATM